MANVLVTTTCPHGCTFCFASQLVEVAGRQLITVGAFERILDTIQNAGGDEVRLVGGEPTSHPGFAELLMRAVGRGLRVTVLSGGFASLEAEEAFVAAPEEMVSVVLNVNAAMNRDGIGEIRKTIERVAPRAALACTIDQVPWNSAPIEDLVELRSLRQPARVRVGIAHPEEGGPNRWLSPSKYVAAARVVARLARRLHAKGARLELDCGFVRCAFDEETMARLRDADARLRFECRPIVDLTPEGNALHCLALGRRLAMDGNHRPIPELRRLMLRRRQGFDEVGLYRECVECAWRISGECDGGCLAVRLRRFERLGLNGVERGGKA